MHVSPLTGLVPSVVSTVSFDWENVVQVYLAPSVIFMSSLRTDISIVWVCQKHDHHIDGHQGYCLWSCSFGGINTSITKSSTLIRVKEILHFYYNHTVCQDDNYTDAI